MKLKKIFQGIIIALLIILGYFNLSIAVDKNESKATPNDLTEEYIQWLNLSENERQNTIEPIAYEIKYNKTPINTFYRFRTLVGETTLEKQYDLRDSGKVTSVKNQYNTNLCWGFSTLSVLESNLAKKTNKIYDFSETHLAYGTSSINTTNNKRGFYKQADSVGNFPKALTYLTNGLGAVEESEMPFETTYDNKDISEITNITPITKIEDTIDFEPISYDLNSSERTKQINAVKKHIKENGAVYSSIRSAVMSDEEFYNKGNAAFYYNGEGLIDHAITIVGWDDTYSKNNFNTRPTNDGAWIVKNSWGTEWGKNGYFYVSYEDTQIGKYMSGIINCSTTIDYDNLYQHDELGASGWVYYNDSNKIYGANVFKKGNKVELLKEVSINIGQEEYVKVYVNPKNSSKSIEDLIEVSGYELLKPGYHTIKFDKSIALTGDEFVVVVEYYSPGKVAIAQTERKYETGEYSKVVQNPGESYITSDIEIDNGWEESQYGNLTIKAFTTNTEETDIFEITDAKISPAIVYNNNSGTITASTKSNYTPDGSKFDIRIKKDGKYVTEKFIIKKNVIQDNIGNIEISILPKIEAGDYIAEISYGKLAQSKEIKFNIKQYIYVDEIILSQDNIEMRVGDTKKITATVLPTNAINKNFTISVENPNIISVNNNLEIKALDSGTTVINITSEDKATTVKCYVSVKGKFQIGDVNGSSNIDATDLLLLKRHIISGSRKEWILVSDSLYAADLNKDGKVDATDLLQLKRIIK